MPHLDVAADMKAKVTLGKDSEEGVAMASGPQESTAPFRDTPRMATKVLDSHLQLSQSQGLVYFRVKGTARSRGLSQELLL